MVGWEYFVVKPLRHVCSIQNREEPMELENLKNQWRQVRDGLLATLAKLNDGELAYVPYPGAWNTGALLRHVAYEELVEVHYGLMHRLPEFPGEIRPEDFPTLASIGALLGDVHAVTEAYLDELAETDLDQDFTAAWNQTRRMGDFLWHTLEHEIHHRGELSLILGMLGKQGLDA
jgi:uncharacterized damage-inducible protein DinB